jgi:hypothetical protein
MLDSIRSAVTCASAGGAIARHAAAIAAPAKDRMSFMAGILPVGVIDLVGLIDVLNQLDAMNQRASRATPPSAHETLHLALNDGVTRPETNRRPAEQSNDGAILMARCYPRT